jgi:hypothetical protein
MPANARPLFVSRICNRVNIEALWDTGAGSSLIHESLADRLLTKGAEKIKLYPPCRFKGVGDGTLETSIKIRTNLIFEDGKPRQIEAFSVPSLPYEMIVGQPFMCEHRLAGLLLPEGFRLLDFTNTQKPVYIPAKRTLSASESEINTIMATIEEANAPNAQFEPFRGKLSNKSAQEQLNSEPRRPRIH